jgi:hypothetical protein
MKIQFLRRITAITLLASAKMLIAALSILIAAISGSTANAQCPPVGADSGCGVVITVTNTGATISRSGQPPYDNIEDTLVGVINNSNRPISALGLRSSVAIFGFDGDGLCAVQPHPAGCPYGPTGYEGPGVSFSAISSDQKSGTVNFSAPISTGGGTAYFSLEEDISAACSCAEVVNHSVTHSSGGATVTKMTAIFTPQCGGSTTQTAQYCGFTKFDWIQKITTLPDPSPFFAVNPANPGAPIHLTSASTPFNDPYRNGYTYNPAWNSYPFYFDPNTTSQPWSLSNWDNGTTLSFEDNPQDPCLPGGNSINVTGCNGSHAPAGSYLGFTTHLAGILPDGSSLDLGVGFTWKDTYNGGSGGISTTASLDPVAPGGTGGITVTGEQTVTNYQYNGIVVTTVNGVPVGGDTTPPVVTVFANPSTLWPPNGKMVFVTISGMITDNESGGTGVNPSTAAYTVTDEYGQVEPHGSVSLQPNGSYSFSIQLQASRAGNDQDGRHYIITVDAQDNGGNTGLATIGVTVPHDQGH